MTLLTEREERQKCVKWLRESGNVIQHKQTLESVRQMMLWLLDLMTWKQPDPVPSCHGLFRLTKSESRTLLSYFLPLSVSPHPRVISWISSFFLLTLLFPVICKSSQIFIRCSDYTCDLFVRAWRASSYVVVQMVDWIFKCSSWVALTGKV